MNWPQLQEAVNALIVERAKANGVAPEHITNSTMRGGGITPTRREIMIYLWTHVLQCGEPKFCTEFRYRTRSSPVEPPWRPLSTERIGMLLNVHRTDVIYHLRKVGLFNKREIVSDAPDYAI